MLLLWTRRAVRKFGVRNPVGPSVALIVSSCPFGSVWRLYAMIVSVVIY